MSNSTTHTNKDVIYIDADDEITAIIDKVRSSNQRIVALVLPKRAAVMQSIVNMKLLKRTADEARKHVVLITSESSLLPLAGSVGLHVAKTLQSRPEIPLAPAAPNTQDFDDDTVDMAEPRLDRRRPIGEYTGVAASPLRSAAATSTDEEDAIELDNTAPAEDAKTDTAPKPTPKKNKKLMIPDFNKFRLVLILGGVGVLLLGVGLFFALAVMPKATVAIKTDSSAIQINTDVTLSADTREVDTDALIVPAVVEKTQKTQAQEVETTGKKDVGEKATGTIRFYNCNQTDTLAGNDRTIPAGTGVSAGGLTFITTKAVTVEPSNFNGSTCRKNKLSSPVGVVAQSSGDKYNVGATSYKVAGYDTITGSGSAMTGGTSEIVRVVAQADIDNAKQKIGSQDTSSIRTELEQVLETKGLYPLVDTFMPVDDTQETISINVGSESDTVTVTQKTTYTMQGVKRTDLEKLITHEVNKEIDKDKQSILDYGLDGASFKMQNQQGSTSLVTMSVTPIAGSDLDLGEIKQQVAGKKASEAKEIIGDYPGVTEVDVQYSPFWVRSIPKKTGKITITVEKPQVKNVEQ